MIRTVSLENFKAHARTTLELGRLTVLVGPNGVGKTSVLEAVHYFSQLIKSKSPHELFANEREPRYLVRGGAPGLKIAEAGTRDDGTEWTASVEVSLGADETWSSKLNPPAGDSDCDEKHTFSSANRNHPLWPELASAVHFRFDSQAIARPGYSEHATPRVEFDGRNTAAALAAMVLANDERYGATIDSLRAIVPSVKDVRVVQVPTGQNGGRGFNGYALEFDFASAKGMPASAASDGTRLTLALLTALNAKSRPRLILIDDIEQSLHPTAQLELVSHLKKLLEQNPKLQIVASTHSPYVLDGVDPDAIWVFARAADGAIAYRRLSEHPDAERSKGTLSSGQLWTLDPESWVTEERSA